MSEERQEGRRDSIQTAKDFDSGSRSACRGEVIHCKLLKEPKNEEEDRFPEVRRVLLL